MTVNKHILLWSSLGTLALLIAAAYSENRLQGWRILQQQYRNLLPPDPANDFSVQLRQIVVASPPAADRCVSCHVGMAPGETGIPGHPVFDKHPKVVHDPAEMGCTICHGGQGRATAREDAHGTVPHWPEPMLTKRLAYAGCGSCHTPLGIPPKEALDRLLAALERNDCLACHRLDGRGGTLRPGGAGGLDGPDLSLAGYMGFDPGWHEGHLQKKDAVTSGPWRAAFRGVSPSDRTWIEAYLRTRVGAPGLVEAKATAASQGCLGCHKIGGVGGDDGPELTEAGLRDPGRLDFSRVPGEKTLANWHGEHFRSPAKIVADSQMPIMGLGAKQIEALSLYMLSLRRTKSQHADWPLDRTRAERLHEREFAKDGAALFSVLCSACHGPRGEGLRYAGLPSFPAIGTAGFLALATDDFLMETIRRGRPGRRMPGWGEAAGLKDEEMRAIVKYMRELGGGVSPVPDSRPPRWIQGDAELGKRLFSRHCAACHGANGEGLEGPSLANPNLLTYASDAFLYETVRRGRGGTSMAAFGQPSTVRPSLTDAEIESIVAFIRTWEK